MNLMKLVARMNYMLTQGDLDREVTSIVYDSRKVEPGCVFVCMPGAVTDGHKYVADALEKGAVALVVQHDVTVDVPLSVTVLHVPNPRLALAELSAAWFDHPAEKLTTIGVTGTKGKTTTTYM
ncbi:MAG: Mur ligase domain-containing protein, partial [Clostridiales bacterium]|nr:Mur ligase domain-containing protein [Clostridiales bacterium]